VNGRVVGSFLVLTGAIAGLVMWYLQVYAFYDPVLFEPGAEILLTPIEGNGPEPILAENVQGIDATSSPLRFRACFTTPLSQAMLTETYLSYPGAVPLTAPSWFDCFDAAEIGEALERGEAVAFLSQAGVHSGVDRVVAVFGDGRAFAWHQLAPGAAD
jgi:Family of unknown function (DUF6446)